MRRHVKLVHVAAQSQFSVGTVEIFNRILYMMVKKSPTIGSLNWDKSSP